MDLSKELSKLKKLMEDGKIQFYKDDNETADDLRKVMMEQDGTVVEETVSPRLKEILLDLRGRGE